MGRLTKKEASGKWQVNGIPWEKIRKGEVITEDMSQRLYGCLCKLKDYEDTGMSPQQIHKRLEDVVMKLKEIKSVIFDDICLYQKSDTGIYENIWKGKPECIPDTLTDYTIKIIGAKRKGVLDIEIRM